MQFDQQRAFPYPVLRPDVNDYADGDFQVTADVQPTDSDLSVLTRFQSSLSVPEIHDQIDRGNASFGIVVSCRETYYHDVIFSQGSAFEHQFNGGSLRGEVQISPYVVVRKLIKNFKCKLINKE